MYIDTVPNRTSPPAILVRVASRQGGKIVKRTLANISDWPPDQVEALRRVLRGDRVVAPESLFAIQRFGTGAVCDQQFCDGIKIVTCAK